MDVKDFIAAVMHDLKLDPEKVEIEYVNAKTIDRRGSIGFHTYFRTGKSRIRIALKGQGSDAILFDTLAHELRHAWQYANEVVKLQGDEWVWQGSPFAPKRHKQTGRGFTRYLEDPKEIDARCYARWAVGAFSPHKSVEDYYAPSELIKDAWRKL